MTGPNWPNNGEIDIIEGVNTGDNNQMTMHTSDGCTLAGNNCQGNLGCDLKPTVANSYGTNFNNANGGTYAMEWTSDNINIWFFSRGSAPSDILGSNPDPAGWGAATANFAGGSGCTIDDHFNNNNIVFDTTFCGDWAGGVWSQDGTCSALAGTCQDYVQNNPSAFAEAYWTVNSLKVYQNDGSAPAVNVPAKVATSTLIKAPIVHSTSVAVPQHTAPEVKPTPSPAPQQPAPSPVQAPPHTHIRTKGEVFESSETGLASLEIIPRDVVVEGPQDTLNKSNAALPSPPEPASIDTANDKVRRATRHLYRHTHYLKHHS